MSNGDLQNRTRAALIELRSQDWTNIPIVASASLTSVAMLLEEWLKDAPLIGNLARSRALNGRLMDDQKHLIGALQAGIQQAERYPEDGPMQTFKAIALRRINKSLEVPP